MTADDPAGSSATRRPQGWRTWVLAAMCLGVAAVGIVLVTYRSPIFNRATEDRQASNAPAGTMTWQPGNADARTAGMLTDPAATDPLSLNPQRAPLVTEPAGLAPPPGGSHERGFTTSDGGLLDEVSFWRIADGDLATLAEHYERAARDKGFVPLGTPTATREDARTLLLRDPYEPNRVLTVRLAARPQNVHVTVWLRYAVPPSRPPASNP